VLKLGWSGCKSQCCSALVRGGRGRTGQGSRRELGSEAQREGSVACFLQIGKEDACRSVEEALRKGTQTFT